MPKKQSPRPKHYKRRRHRGGKRDKVSSVPRQIQCANYIPKNRLIKFQDFRSFVLTDNSNVQVGQAYHALCPNLQLGANNPTQAFIGSGGVVGTTGSWYSQSADPSNGVISKGNAVPNLNSWVTAQDGSGDGQYRCAQVLGARLTISCVPLSSYVSTDTQDVTKLCVQVATMADAYKDKRVSSDFNSEKISQLSGTKTANIYSNYNGTPRGATISMNYSYKKMNATLGRMANNTFQNDASPGEKDYFNVSLLPCENASYGIGATSNSAGTGRIPKMRVSVKLSYICLLSEPNNTTIGIANNTGTELPIIPMRETSTQDSGLV